MMWLYIWLGVVAVSLIIEFVTMELVSVWISIGALVALILAAFGVGYEIQIITMIVVSIACILGLRKVTLKFLNRNKDRTNLDLIVGTKTKLLTPITENEMGSIKINGVVWSACTENLSQIEKGSFVEVEGVEGNKLIVKKVEEEKLENKNN